MNRFGLFLRFMLLMAGFSIVPHVVFSHALNPDSMDRYAEITLTPSHIVVIFQVMAGINGTDRITEILDADEDGEISDAERDATLAVIAKQYGEKQIVKINGSQLDLDYRMGDVYGQLGHNGINVLKLDLAYVAAYPADIPRGTTCTFSYEDVNFQKVLGWKQMQLFSQDGVVYDGHIPYTQYKPFDYEIMVTKGFTPSTEKIEGKVTLPSMVEDAPVALALPERPTVVLKSQNNFGPLITVLIVFAIVILGVVMILFWMAKKSGRSDHIRYD